MRIGSFLSNAADRSEPRRRRLAVTTVGAAVSIALLLMPIEAFSRTKQKNLPERWTHEPTTFMSLPLGGTLGRASRCAPALAIREVTSVPPSPCWTGESNVKTLYDLPSPGFPIASVVAVTYDDTIGTVIVNGLREDYASMKSYLIDNYGQPTQSAMKPMGQQGGMMLGVENLRWDGRNVAIQLEEIYNRVDMFRVVVVHKPSTPHTALVD